jgi:hypothetical protein
MSAQSPGCESGPVINVGRDGRDDKVSSGPENFVTRKHWGNISLYITSTSTRIIVVSRQGPLSFVRTRVCAVDGRWVVGSGSGVVWADVLVLVFLCFDRCTGRNEVGPSSTEFTLNHVLLFFAVQIPQPSLGSRPGPVISAGRVQQGRGRDMEIPTETKVVRAWDGYP